MTTAPRTAPIWTRKISIGTGVSHDHIVQFARHLGLMEDASVPLSLSLDKIALAMESDSPRLATILRQVAVNVQKYGMSLSDAFRPYARVVGDTFIELIAAGENSGSLTTSALPAIARIYSSLARSQRARITASLYPIAVLLFSFAMTYVAANYVLPGIRPLFDLPGGHQDLPLITRLMLAYTDLWTSPSGWLVLAGIVAAAVAAYRAANRSARLRPLKDRWKLRVPVYGKLWQAETFSETLAVLGSMIAAGIPMPKSLELAARTSPNRAVGEALRSIITSVERDGSTLHQALATRNIFPATVLAAIEVGEDSGSLDATTALLADFFFEEARERRKRVEQVTEYVLMGLMGLYVAAIVISMFLPVYQGIDKLTGR